MLSLLNLFGLGIGFASFLVISFYVIQESSYEQSFENSERTYRIATHHGGFGDVAQSTSNLAHTIEEIPGIEVFTALTKSENDKVKIGENTFGMKRLFEVDKAFFDVFDYELLHGDFNTALGKPNQVVLMEEQALRLFNKTDVLGESIEIMNRGDFIITGVIKTPIYKSHLSFDLLIPRDKMTFRTSRWNTTNAYCYVMLEKGMDAQVVNNNLLGLVEKHVWPLNSDYFPDMTFEEWAQGEFRTQYYNSTYRGDLFEIRSCSRAGARGKCHRGEFIRHTCHTHFDYRLYQFHQSADSEIICKGERSRHEEGVRNGQKIIGPAVFYRIIFTNKCFCTISAGYYRIDNSIDQCLPARNDNVFIPKCFLVDLANTGILL